MAVAFPDGINGVPKTMPRKQEMLGQGMYGSLRQKNSSISRTRW